ncbi:hypothetical protein [Arthrobacter psychrolactophilus]
MGKYTDQHGDQAQGGGAQHADALTKFGRHDGCGDVADQGADADQGHDECRSGQGGTHVSGAERDDRQDGALANAKQQGWAKCRNGDGPAD